MMALPVVKPIDQVAFCRQLEILVNNPTPHLPATLIRERKAHGIKFIAVVGLGALALISYIYNRHIAMVLFAAGAGCVAYFVKPDNRDHREKVFQDLTENLAEGLNFYARTKQAHCELHFGEKNLQEKGLDFECAKKALEQFVKVYDGESTPTHELDKYIEQFPEPSWDIRDGHRPIIRLANQLIGINFNGVNLTASIRQRILNIQKSAFILIYGYHELQGRGEVGVIYPNRSYVNLYMDMAADGGPQMKAIPWVRIEPNK
jgi:hypothetical protein